MNPAAVAGLIAALIAVTLAFFFGREYGKTEVKEYAKLASAQLRHAEEVRRLAQEMLKDAGVSR